MTAIRVCHCIENLAACGAQQIVRHLVTHLDRDRFQPMVYTFQEGPLLDPIERAGIMVRLLPRRLPKLDPGLVLRIRRALKQDAAQILHMHLFGACLHGTLAGAGSTVRKIVTLHADREDNSLQSLGYPGVFRAADAVVAVSRHAAEALGRRYSGLPSKTTVILNGIDLAPFAQVGTKQQARRALGLPEDRPLVGTVGRLVRQKGHDVLLAAFVEVRTLLPDAQLLVIGEGELLQSLRQTADHLGLNGAVRFLGSRSDVPRLLVAVDVFVLTSRFEGLPLVLLEAMAAGTPVVTTGVGGIPEVVTHGQEGLVVRPEDAHELQLALYQVLTDPSIATRLAQKALGKVHEHYGVRRMVREHEALYERLVRQTLPS